MLKQFENLMLFRKKKKLTKSLQILEPVIGCVYPEKVVNMVGNSQSAGVARKIEHSLKLTANKLHKLQCSINATFRFTLRCHDLRSKDCLIWSDQIGNTTGVVSLCELFRYSWRQRIIKAFVTMISMVPIGNKRRHVKN